MAEMISTEDIANIKRDMDDTGKAINEVGIVEPRYGSPFNSIPMVAQILIQTGGFEPFSTETELLASTPIVSKQAALALDTENLHFWNGTVWSLAGSISMNSAVMRSLVAIYDPSFVYKGKANLGATAPASPVSGDTYIAVADGTTFGILAQSGQLLTYNGSVWKIGGMLEVFNRKYIATGGNGYIVDKNSLLIAGYINSSGSFVSSGAGYKLSYYKPVIAGSTLKFALNAGATVSAVAYYDANLNYLSGVIGNGTSTERSVIIPANAVYARFSNNSTALSTPYCNQVFVSLLDSQDVVKGADLTVTASPNLAKTQYIVDGSYVNSAGGIVTAAGWKHIKIPVTAGTTYTFGRFSIDSAGYYAFQDSVNTLISGSNGSYQTSTLPKTLTAPTGAAWLLFDIARPTNLPEHYAQLTCNVGGTLIDYVEPTDTITAINGKKLAGSGGGDVPENIVVQGGNATLADIIVDSVTTGALIANLPTSPTGLEVGQAYIDVDTIKVVI